MILDKINVPATAIGGIIVIILTILTNPQFQTAIASLFSHPTPTQWLSAIGVIAGVILLYIAKPIGTSSAPKGP